jgi:hypothetical protein
MIQLSKVHQAKSSITSHPATHISYYTLYWSMVQRGLAAGQLSEQLVAHVARGPERQI